MALTRGDTMSKIFDPTSEELKYLLESIHNRELALPDFQRDFVWEPRATEELIESICQNYPAGSLLRIRNSTGFFFKPREFAAAPLLNGHQPSYLILDGQQRLTSLYQAFYGQGNHSYFMHLGGLLAGRDLEDCVYYLRKDVAKRYSSLKEQSKDLVFPFEALFANGQGFEKWLDDILELREETEAERKDLKNKLRKVRETWLENVEHYKFPMVTLAEDTSAAAVCTIFETLNRTGVKLSVFDLLAARFWPEDVRLRDMWDKAKSDHSIIDEFEVDPYYILQAVAIFTTPAAPSCKRSDVLKMQVSQIVEGWDPVVNGLAEALHILRNDCGVVLPQWLPYGTIVVPAAAILAEVGKLSGPNVASSHDKFRRWFWCSVFGQAYENAPNSQSAKDYIEFKRWIAQGVEPETVSQYDFDVKTLRTTTPRQRAVYRGAIALILRNGARDLHTGNLITANMIREKKIEDHHVFPQAFLNEVCPTLGSTARDCVLNRTLIDAETNNRIGKRPPTDYLAEISTAVGSDLMTTILRSHLLPDLHDPAIWHHDHFEDFLDQRERLMETQLKAVTT